MGHTKPSDLKDLQKILAKVRAWEFIKEKSPNVFYFKAIPFLHFHDKDGERWADVREGEGWKNLALPFDSTSKAQDNFLKLVQKQYAKILK